MFRTRQPLIEISDEAVIVAFLVSLAVIAFWIVLLWTLVRCARALEVLAAIRNKEDFVKSPPKTPDGSTRVQAPVRQKEPRSLRRSMDHRSDGK